MCIRDSQYPVGTTANEFIDVCYHELGHASHYITAGESFWIPLRIHVVANGGGGEFPDFIGIHGDLNALAEAVAEYVEEIYGPNRNNRIWRSNYIPAGLLQDLEDPINNADWVRTVAGPFQESVDIIAGFNRGMFYDVLDSDVRNIRDSTLRILERKGGKESCLLYTSPSPRDATLSRMPSSA